MDACLLYIVVLTLSRRESRFMPRPGSAMDKSPEDDLDFLYGLTAVKRS